MSTGVSGVSGATTGKNQPEETLEQYVARMKNEAQSLTFDQLKQRVKALETETSSMKSEVNRMRKEMSKSLSLLNIIYIHLIFQEISNSELKTAKTN